VVDGEWMKVSIHPCMYTYVRVVDVFGLFVLDIAKSLPYGWIK